MQPDDISKSDYEALAQYRYAIRRFLRFSEEAARKEGVTPQQYQLMLTVKGYPGRDYANITEIAERMQLDHHSTVGLIDRTAERGLVRREHAAKDRRQVHIFLTDEGVALLSRLAQLHRDELDRMTADLRPPGFTG